MRLIRLESGELVNLEHISAVGHRAVYPWEIKAEAQTEHVIMTIEGLCLEITPEEYRTFSSMTSTVTVAELARCPAPYPFPHPLSTAGIVP